MQTIRNIEFFNDPEGGVMVRDTEGVHTYQPEDKMLTGALFTRIETEYPKAFKALAEIYRKSRANVNYYRFLICHRFIRCNFGRLDNRQDIDGMGRFTFEDVSCPIKGECKYAGIICSPEFDTRLTERQNVRVTDFRFIPITAEEIEAYKDWQVGDRLRKKDGSSRTIEVIFRFGELIVGKFIDTRRALTNYTCDELYEDGFRLIVDPAPEEEIVEVTMDEIAKLKGVPVERLRMKKEDK